MLFNSYLFIFVFLPIVLAGAVLLSRIARRDALLVWLLLSSFVFYAHWNANFLILLIGSIVINYVLAQRIRAAGSTRVGGRLLLLGIAGNLATIAYFKYANFFLENVSQVTGSAFEWTRIVLPIAISFFTFQQIAYLVDSRRGQVQPHRFIEYALFVAFFPQLIAGPIVHHSEMLGQLKRLAGPRAANIAIGATIFVIGLSKKVLIADPLGSFGGPVFAAADAGAPISFLAAWAGALSFTFQLYFDFSGYSDMAIGLARLFGVRLPLNFASPYKATSIIEFWRTWHITLSRFLRDYLYFPLGGNRRGPARRYINLLITMLLGGLWHGAGWGFILWGGLHGIFLIVNHAWRKLRGGRSVETAYGRLACWALSFLAVIFAWVFFRADTTDGAFTIVTAMIAVDTATSLATDGLTFGWEQAGYLGVAAVIALGLPNTQELMSKYRPALNFNRYATGPALLALRWRPSLVWGLAFVATLVLGIFAIAEPTEFLYFEF
ncbi:MAG: MBOAT family protein [Alphaproteobacteria bacterium]